jgi:hypothetical protein
MKKMHAWLDVVQPVPGPPGLPRVIYDEGVALPVRTIIDMRGAGVTATDDMANDRTVITIPGAAAAPVSSVFTRTGAIVAVSGDYTAAQVTNAVSVLGSYADPAWITSLAYSKLTGVPAAAVSSVFGRTGAVVAQSGDYTAALVTNAVSTAGSYNDPAWINSLGWTKITGAPSSFPPSVHVHAAADVTSGVFAVARLGTGTPTSSVYLRGDGQWASVPIPADAVTSVFGRAGVVVAQSGDYAVAQVTGAVPDTRTIIAGSGLSGGGALTGNVTLSANIAGIQTPWLQAVNAAGYALNNAGDIHTQTDIYIANTAPGTGEFKLDGYANTLYVLNPAAAAMLALGTDGTGTFTGKVNTPAVTLNTGAEVSSFAEGSGGKAVTVGGEGFARTLRVRGNTIYFHVGAAWDVECENDTVYFAKTSNTVLNLRMRGSDGVVRSVNLTLS